MKRFIALLLALAMCFSFVACSSSTDTATEATAAPAESTDTADTADTATDVTETAYPERSINMTIPFGAGGGTDLWARVMAEYMGDYLGVQIICTNVEGGSAGSTGTASVWDAEHDGYTLVGTSETPLTIPVMTALEQTSADWEYFIAAGSPGLFCVNKATYDAGIQSMEDLTAALNADPESISVAGTTGGLWFALASLFSAYGDTPLYWVSYPGSGDAIVGCHSGEADTVVASAGEVMSYVQSGDLIPLAVMETESWEFPDYGVIPAVTDAVPEIADYLALKQVLGFAMPADTDPAILAKITEAFDAAMANEDLIAYAADNLCVTYGASGDEAKEMMTDLESSLCWVLYDMGMTTFSPEDFGIER